MLKQELSDKARQLYEEAAKMSAEDISAQANLRRLEAQRQHFRATAWPRLAANFEHSVFYQLDLDDAAAEFQKFHLPMPEPLSERSEEHTSELQSRQYLVCRLLLEK